MSTVTGQQRFEKFRRLCREERPPVKDGLAWADLVEKNDLEKSMRAVRRFIQAVRTGRQPTVPFPEMREFIKPEWAPHITPGVGTLIGEGLALSCTADREGYAWDLHFMSTKAGTHGPEHPCGWVPFLCIIAGKTRGLVVGMCPFEDPGQDRVVFGTLRELMSFVTDGPFDELDRLRGG